MTSDVMQADPATLAVVRGWLDALLEADGGLREYFGKPSEQMQAKMMAATRQVGASLTEAETLKVLATVSLLAQMLEFLEFASAFNPNHCGELPLKTIGVAGRISTLVTRLGYSEELLAMARRSGVLE